VLLALADAYAMVGAMEQHKEIIVRLASMAQPMPIR
jgi:hypothetical protein